MRFLVFSVDLLDDIAISVSGSLLTIVPIFPYLSYLDTAGFWTISLADVPFLESALLLLDTAVRNSKAC